MNSTIKKSYHEIQPNKWFISNKCRVVPYNWITLKKRTTFNNHEHNDAPVWIRGDSYQYTRNEKRSERIVFAMANTKHHTGHHLDIRIQHSINESSITINLKHHEQHDYLKTT